MLTKVIYITPKNDRLMLLCVRAHIQDKYKQQASDVKTPILLTKLFDAKQRGKY